MCASWTKKSMVLSKPWYSQLRMKLQMLGFVPSKGDASLFFFKEQTVTMYILVYVDDIIVVVILRRTLLSRILENFIIF
jgi:hypothetical protein